MSENVVSYAAAPFTGGTSLLLNSGVQKMLGRASGATGVAVPQPIAPATTQDKAVQQAAGEAAQRRSRARGYRSTILSQMTQNNTGLQDTMGS